MSNSNYCIAPKTVKKLRKVSYPAKRENYRRYCNASWKWEDIFCEIDMLKCNNNSYIKIISEKYNIKYCTLKRKYSEWKKKDKNICNENRGGHNRMFTEKEERYLYEYIVNVFIECNLIFNNNHLKLLAIQQYHMLQKEKNPEYIIDETFTISDGWITSFKKKWKFSSLRTKLSKKSTKIDPTELTNFLTDCKKSSKTVDKRFIFNLDETFWKINSTYDKVIGFTNSDHRKVDVSIDPKSGFTAVFLISADGNFLKPTIILKGKTDRCLNKIKEISNNDVSKKYSLSGWINSKILLEILDTIKKITKDNDSILILDKYPIHMDELIQNKAKKLNIKLIYVPTGKTSENQPLDVNVNGPIKSMGKQIANKIFLKDPFAKYTLVNSIEALITATKKISKSTIVNSFGSACNI